MNFHTFIINYFQVHRNQQEQTIDSISVHWRERTLRENVNEKVENSQSPLLEIEFIFFLKLFHNVIKQLSYFHCWKLIVKKKESCFLVENEHT